MVKNELLLIKELLPIWSNYTDGFVFLVDSSTDGTEEYLKSISEKYNILEILVHDPKDNELRIETDIRQKLFDTAKKYSNNIICLDADEYLDGTMTKQELESLLTNSEDTVFHLQWIQYTSVNSIRVDGPWKNNYKDRIGSYKNDYKFSFAQMHSTHLPIPKNQNFIDPTKLFVSHLQWLNKNFVAVKQYYWKVTDYVNNKVHGVEVAGTKAYDDSVNNFDWEEEYFDFALKINQNIFEEVLNKDNYRVNYIIEESKKHNVPNLGDWGFNIHNSIPMYFCTATDEKHYPLLLNMIGSIYKFNFYDVVEIRVYDIGLNEIQKTELNNIKKVKVCEIEKTNPDILQNIETGINRKVKGLFSWKPVLIKDSLDHQPYTLYLDAGTTILKPLNDLFKHINQNDYLLFDCGHSIKWMTTKYLIDKLDLESENNKFLLDENTFGIDAGFMGISKNLYKDFVLPMYEYSKDIKNFIDDGTCPNGWGTGRHDQTLFSILARQLGLNLIYHDNKENLCYLILDGNKVDFHITHTKQWITDKTTIFRSRWNIDYQSFKVNSSHIKRKFIISVITGIGPLKKYERFIPTYFKNIQNQINFNNIEFIIVYSEWCKYFDEYIKYSNIKFIKEDERLGVYNAWNIGILNSTAEYITNWNVDDIRFEINSVIKYDCLNKNIDVDLAYNYYIGVEEDELEIVDLNTKSYIPYPDNFHEQVLSMCMAGPDPLWRKAFHLFYGLFDYKNYSIIGDWEMWVRMAANGLKFKLIPYPLSIYVNHKDTVSNSGESSVKDQQLKLQTQYTK
jgi:hypothetical protein